jgi:hypothetical protein
VGRRLPPLPGHTGSIVSWLWCRPPLGPLLAGTAVQATKTALPFRSIPSLSTGWAADPPASGGTVPSPGR